MDYIIILDLNGYTSQQRCIGFSRELFKISRPVSEAEDVTAYLFGWVIHPETGQYALEVDLDTIIPVHPEKDLTAIISMLNPLATAEEIATIVAGMGSAVRFGDMLPAYVEVISYDTMKQNGWFPEFTL
jgi:hypothetical protein